MEKARQLRKAGMEPGLENKDWQRALGIASDMEGSFKLGSDEVQWYTEMLKSWICA